MSSQVTLGEHVSSFVNNKVAEGRYASASEAVWTGLSLLQAEESRLAVLNAAIQAGIDSGLSELTPKNIPTGIKRRLQGGGGLADGKSRSNRNR